jgi:hypothetical protein
VFCVNINNKVNYIKIIGGKKTLCRFMNIPARIAMSILRCFNGEVPKRKLHAQDAVLKI